LNRLDVALIHQYPELSRRRAREVIEKGQVTVGGQTVLEAGHDVPEGAALSWDPNRKARKRVRSSVPLLYEDDHVLIADKPAGLLTVPSAPDARGEDTVLARVHEYVERLRPRHPYVGRVHRLDRDTSGAVAVALDAETRKALIALFSAHRIERQYLALVRGEPREDRGRIDAAIHEDYEAGRRRIARKGEESRPAVTHWEVRGRFGAASLLELRLETGRQHQIRLHLSHFGYPVLGDRVYGPAREPAAIGVKIPRQMLHAERLSFEHPWRNATVEARSPLPADFEAVLHALRRGRRGPPSR
jgi:23S rRNA pseudouridine1911/1915/1917 synthase